MTEELKSCPFCGKEAYIDSFNEVVCIHRGHKAVTKDVKTWNTRPVEDDLRAENAALKAENEQLIKEIEAAKNVIYDRMPPDA